MKNVLMLLTATLAVTSYFAHADTIGAALKECSGEENALKRLVCYDRLVKDMNQYTGLKNQASVALPPVHTQIPKQSVAEQQTAVEPLPAVKPDQNNTEKTSSEFGLENQKIRESVERIDAEIATVKLDPFKKMIISFADGQVWRQTDSARLRLSAGDAVYVERGALGAFYLSKESVNRRIRVKRTK